jgi:uncharacterized protein (DUF433 family)
VEEDFVMAFESVRITKTPDVCGGDACLAGRRYPIWGLVESHLQGVSDSAILKAHPALTQADLDAAWGYYRDNALEIDRAIWENEACMIEYAPRKLPFAMIQRGRELGFTEDEIRDAFDPPLPVGALRSVAEKGTQSAGV